LNTKSTNDSVINVAEYHSNSDIRIKKIGKPLIKEEEILVKMEACGICGTDVMEWYRKASAPKILGHEMSGTIVEMGTQVKNLKLDDRVFVSHHVPCFECRYCKNQKYSACNTLHTGNFFPGGFSEYIRIPKENVKYGTFVLPNEMTFEEATMIEPMACAVAGQKNLNIKKDETVIIIGSGISGLCHIQLAKNKGATVIATDISDYRMDQAMNFGADYSLNAHNIDIDQVKKINSGKLADTVIVCAGNNSAVEESFKYVDKRGSILFFAVPSTDIILPSTKLWRNEISLFFSYGAATDDIAATIKLYKERKINFKEMITHQFPLSQISQGFKVVEQAKESIKVVVNPDKIA
tara:strand:- start:456 stop:1508 length:1053 start_codon:yes stop_codon:yes gene_type:complete